MRRWSLLLWDLSRLRYGIFGRFRYVGPLSPLLVASATSERIVIFGGN